MTNMLPVAYYLNDVDGETAGRAGRTLLGNSSDVAARVAEAHALGVLEGRAAAHADNEAALAKLVASADKKLQAERKQWTVEQGERLGNLVASAIEDLEKMIAAQVARCLKPVMIEAVRERAVTELSSALNEMLSKGEYAAIAISGPEDLLSEMKSRLKGRQDGLTFVASDDPDLTVSADDTILEGRLSAWVGAIHGDGA